MEPTAAADTGQILGALGSMAPMLLIFVIFYFIWFMPLRKKQQALDKLIASLEKGQKVVTTGGLHGEVVKVDKDVVLVELAPNVKVRISRRAIAGLEGSEDEKGS